MFLQFESNNERCRFGSSDFLEIQHCKHPAGTPVREIVSANAIEHWSLTSLYICGDDMGNFCSEYQDILPNGLYSNLEEGPVDACGINYYSEEKAKAVMEKLQACQPTGFETFLAWLKENPYRNGFYILGI